VKLRRNACWFVVLLWTITFLLIFLVPVFAQGYRFRLPENESHLYINQDGTVRIVYDLTFVVDPGSEPIRYVDVGLPSDSYRLSESQASVDGVPAAELDVSPEVDIGIAIDLGANAIRPGDTATVHFETIVRDVIYQDTDDAEYASIEFSPTWFGSSMVSGDTNLQVYFHFPPGVGPDDPRYHDEAFTDAYIEDERVVYLWQNTSASPSRQYTFGASFPKQYVAEGVVQAAPAFTIDFTACCNSPLIWFVVIGGGWLFFAILGGWNQRKRKMQYLPPSLAVEGTGIKRGLTAVEAAILLEAPLDRVMTMILFGLVKKGVVAVESEKPLRLRLLKPVTKEPKLWYYERRFLAAVDDGGKLDEKALRDMTIDLIGDVNKKLTGFGRKETTTYYKDIAARAWKEVAAADTPEVLGERWSEELEWTMLDDDWQDRTREVFRDRPVVVPGWWWYYRPWHAGTGGGRVSAPAAPTGGGGTPVTLPTLPGGDFANTVVTGIENAANTVVGGIERFTSGVTQTTNPPPKPSSSSSRGGGGYSCACACACAGCACACAGGGR
jgi:hypothetical protein